MHVIVEWRIKKGSEQEFLDYWSKRSTIPDRLTAAELQVLLEGLDWTRVHAPRQVTVPVVAS